MLHFRLGGQAAHLPAPFTGDRWWCSPLPIDPSPCYPYHTPWKIPLYSSSELARTTHTAKITHTHTHTDDTIHWYNTYTARPLHHHTTLSTPTVGVSISHGESQIPDTPTHPPPFDVCQHHRTLVWLFRCRACVSACVCVPMTYLCTNAWCTVS